MAWNKPVVSSILGLVLNYKHLVVFHQKLNISLYMYKKGYVTIFLLVYVDDIIVTSSSPSAIDALLTDLKSKFAITNLGSLHYFLGIEVKWTCDVLCYLKKNTLLIFCTRLVCLLANWLLHPCLHRRNYLHMLVIHWARRKLLNIKV
jgi:hypothetical protein